jgi:hypothetical protein
VAVDLKDVFAPFNASQGNAAGGVEINVMTRVRALVHDAAPSDIRAAAQASYAQARDALSANPSDGARAKLQAAERLVHDVEVVAASEEITQALGREWSSGGVVTDGQARRAYWVLCGVSADSFDAVVHNLACSREGGTYIARLVDNMPTGEEQPGQPTLTTLARLLSRVDGHTADAVRRALGPSLLSDLRSAAMGLSGEDLTRFDVSIGLTDERT